MREEKSIQKNPWAAARDRDGLYEIRGARNLEAPERGLPVIVSRTASSTDAEMIAVTLNQIWQALLTCQQLVQEYKPSEGRETTQLRYQLILRTLDDAGMAAARQRGRIASLNTLMLTQTYSLLCRSIRECGALVIRYQPERDPHIQFVGMQRLHEKVRHTALQLQEMYARAMR